MEIINFIEHNNDFEWDLALHFPVPTLNYIMKRTGEDLLKLYDTELSAQGAVIAATRSAKNYLFADRLDMEAWEYYTARDITLLYSVLEYIVEFINFALITGDYIEYFKASTVKIESLGIFSAKQNLISARKVLPYNAQIRVGY